MVYCKVCHKTHGAQPSEPACAEGAWVPDDEESTDAWKAEGAREERAAIVKWLESEANTWRDMRDAATKGTLRVAHENRMVECGRQAQMIERGQHRSPPPPRASVCHRAVAGDQAARCGVRLSEAIERGDTWGIGTRPNCVACNEACKKREA